MSANQGSNKEVRYVGKFYVGSEIPFRLCDLRSAPKGREEKRLIVTTEVISRGKKKSCHLLFDANLQGLRKLHLDKPVIKIQEDHKFS